MPRRVPGPARILPSRQRAELPIHTHGGQLPFGQAAGGMTHVTEGVRQLMGRGEGRQGDPTPECRFVNG